MVLSKVSSWTATSSGDIAITVRASIVSSLACASKERERPLVSLKAFSANLRKLSMLLVASFFSAAASALSSLMSFLISLEIKPRRNFISLLKSFLALASACSTLLFISS